MFQIKQVSEHGTSNPIVARLSIQTQKLLQFSQIDKEKQDETFALYNSKVQKRLLECDTIAQEISNEILDIVKNLKHNGFNIQSQGRSVHVPQIMRLEERTEQFLYSAKSALRDLAKIFEVLFDKKFSEARYDKILSWANEAFGEDSDLTRLIKQDHDSWIKKIVSMRNAVEHPGGHSGTLLIHNFELMTEPYSEEIKIQEPCWQLNNEVKISIIKDLFTFISNMLEFSEDLLVACMYIKGVPDAISIAQIPELERDPSCAIRLKAVFLAPKL